LLRLVWMWPGAKLANLIRRRLLHQQVALPPWKQVFIVGWTGMRGVVALAAAISLPEKLRDGSSFPQRDLIVFLTFSVILVTLVLQGLTLPPLIRLLGVGGLAGPDLEEEQARSQMVEAALAKLKAEQQRDGTEFAEVYKEIEERYRHRLAALRSGERESEHEDPQHVRKYQRLLRELIHVERKTAVRLRNEGRLNDEALRRIEHELDLNELRLSPTA